MKKKTLVISLSVLVLAGLVAYFSLGGSSWLDWLKGGGKKQDKIYTAADYPDALNIMTQDVLDVTIKDLNYQYEKLKEQDRVYIRLVNIGILKKRLNDYTGAEESWLEAAEYAPEQSLAIGNLADLYLFDLQQYQKAEDYYKKALSMRGDNYNYYIGLATLYRYNMTEKKDQIESTLLEGVELNPSEAENYYMYLAIYFSESPDNNGGNDLKKAKEYSQKTLELNSDLKDQLPKL